MLSSVANLVINRLHMYTRFSAISAKKHMRTASPDRFLGLRLMLFFVLLVLYFGCYCRFARQGSACRLYPLAQDGLRKSWYEVMAA